jgi:phosphoserine aminotransferase
MPVRAFNFAAGPATLPLEVLEQVRSELTDWRGSGSSVMEVSHRSKAFIEVAAQAEQDLRELLGITANYRVLFVQGGATGQFSAIPMNLASAESVVDYIDTGVWSKKALTEARRYCRVNVAADEAASSYCTVPDPKSLALTAGAAYLHYTPNETIGGVEFPYIPDTGGVPLIADMSSTLLSRPFDVSRCALISSDGLVPRPPRCGITKRSRRRTPCSTPRRPSPGTWRASSSNGCAAMAGSPPSASGIGSKPSFCMR